MATVYQLPEIIIRSFVTFYQVNGAYMRYMCMTSQQNMQVNNVTTGAVVVNNLPFNGI